MTTQGRGRLYNMNRYDKKHFHIISYLKHSEHRNKNNTEDNKRKSPILYGSKATRTAVNFSSETQGHRIIYFKLRNTVTPNLDYYI